ncbi:MAG: dihydrofolate reductase [Flavobacteriaceae bacterium]|nr:dihydrofolate reductase [Flavobacteriaceae bacterium]
MITIIAAIDSNYGIGKNNQLIWHLPADLKRFKSKTTGHHIIMGRNTFESLGKALPNRTTIVISRNNNFQIPDGCILVDTLNKAIEIASTDDSPFIIGGAEIYKEAMPIAEKLEITHVHHAFEADAFFPEIDSTIWKEVSREDFKADEKNKYDYSFMTFVRI